VILLVAAFVLLVAGTAGTGLLAHRLRWSVAGGPGAWGAAAARRFGPVPGALVVLVAGLAGTAVVGLALGFLAKAVQSGVDEPTFRWIHPRVHDNNLFSHAQDKLTMVGNNPIVQLVCFFSVLILACAYRRRWWLPPLAVAVALIAEKYLQRFLGRVVHRGHPPTTLGTYPSGGVGRILAVYGTILILFLLLQPRLSRAWRAGLWTGLAGAAVMEAFSRLYLSKHWLTDALFGLPFGTLLLLTNVTAVCALAGAGAAGATAARPRTQRPRATAVR
jgi:PAP2 superfamily protein